MPHGSPTGAGTTALPSSDPEAVRLAGRGPGSAVQSGELDVGAEAGMPNPYAGEDVKIPFAFASSAP